MIFNPTHLEDAFLIDVEPHADERGFLARTFCEREFAEHGLPMRIVQSSTIHSPRCHTLRGLHYQAAPHEEVKLVRCVRGRIQDVVVDLRPESSTYLRAASYELSADNQLALYIPAGCAHGLLTLEDDCHVLYQISTEHVPEAARGARWNDPAVAIEWALAPVEMSPRDASYPDYDR